MGSNLLYSSSTNLQSPFLCNSLHVSIDHLFQRTLIYFILILFNTGSVPFTFKYTQASLTIIKQTQQNKNIFSTLHPLLWFSFLPFIIFVLLNIHQKHCLISLLPSPVSSAIIWLELFLRGYLDFQDAKGPTFPLSSP